jgi:hypothetical protein
MKDLVHVAIGGCYCLLRTAAVLTRAQIGCIPIPPVMLGVRLLEVAVVLFRFRGRALQGSRRSWPVLVSTLLLCFTYLEVTTRERSIPGAHRGAVQAANDTYKLTP